MHHINLANKGIQTFKGHFKSVLCGVEDLFPLNLCNNIIPQTEMQVNILHQANMTSKLSAYAYLNIPHDFNSMPMAPLGCAVQIHKNSNRRASWAPHSISGWYLVIPTEPYR